MYRTEADEFHRDAGGPRVQTSKLQRTAEARRVFATFPSSSSYSSRTDEKVFLIFPAAAAVAVAEAAAALSPNSYSTSRSLARPLFLAPFKAGAVIAHGEADEEKREGAGGREGGRRPQRHRRRRRRPHCPGRRSPSPPSVCSLSGSLLDYSSSSSSGARCLGAPSSFVIE